ncbi:MAG: hypothetical protein WCA15_15820 [Candidatus Acidiferrales bacterium]
MKRFRRSRDDGRLALTTLQNPTLEVRSRSELIAAAQKNVAEEACPPTRDAAAPEVSPVQNSASPAEVLEPQPDSPEPSPETRPRKPNPFPIRMEVRTQPSGEMEFRYVLGEREPPPFAPIRDAATRARLAKHFTEERAKASQLAATEPPASPISSSYPEYSEPPSSSPAEESDQPAPPITWTNPSYPITTYNLRPDYSSASPSSNSSPCSMPPSQPTSPDFNRHSRRCAICCHADRDAIEADFVRWRSPDQIVRDHQISGGRTSLYRHVRAVGLYQRRKQEMGRVLESILESVDICTPDTFDVIIRAARLYAHLDANGRWFEAPRTQYVVYGPPPDEYPTGNFGSAQSPNPSVGARHAVPVLNTAMTTLPLAAPKKLDAATGDNAKPAPRRKPQRKTLTGTDLHSEFVQTHENKRQKKSQPEQI